MEAFLFRALQFPKYFLVIKCIWNLTWLGVTTRNWEWSNFKIERVKSSRVGENYVYFIKGKKYAPQIPDPTQNSHSYLLLESDVTEKAHRASSAQSHHHQQNNKTKHVSEKQWL